MNDATGRNTARRRRADTIARCERIMETARRLPLTRDVLAEAIERATPVQLDLMESWLDAEIASRERSKRVRLLKAAGFPNAKDIEGHCVCSIESGPCERVDVFHVSGRFWSTSACGEKRTPARPAWTSFPS